LSPSVKMPIGLRVDQIIYLFSQGFMILSKANFLYRLHISQCSICVLTRGKVLPYYYTLVNYYILVSCLIINLVFKLVHNFKTQLFITCTCYKL